MPNLILYNYPSFSGSYSAVFAHIYYTHLQIPHLILQFSSVEPLRVIAFDHSKLAVSKVPSNEECPDNLELNINVQESSSRAVYNYFSNKLLDTKCTLYIEDGELNKWNLPNTKAFNISLMELDPTDLIIRGNVHAKFVRSFLMVDNQLALRRILYYIHLKLQPCRRSVKLANQPCRAYDFPAAQIYARIRLYISYVSRGRNR
ncbi:hypothetical protein MKX01_013517 [Papaver californicum]|nr:hypothetical protein MKX01_013517 [Papaver californicum]